MRNVLGALMIVLIGVVVLYAHHGWTGYDETKTVQLTGVIKEAGYENPHGFVNLEVDKTGETAHTVTPKAEETTTTTTK